MGEGKEMNTIELTDEEKKAIRALKSVAKKWPKSLWLFAHGGSLSVLRKDENGQRVMTNSGGVDQDYVVDSVDGIENDGGDW